MDGSRFDSLLRVLADVPSRRGVLRLLAGSAVGGFLSHGADPAAARKKKKVTFCHSGQTITVAKKKKKSHLKHGDTPGPCPAPPPPPPPPSPPSQLVIAYECTNANGLFRPFPAGSRLAQTFKAAAGGQLERAEVVLLSNDADADLEFELRSVDASGQPDAVLATTTVTDVPATMVGTDPPRTVTAPFDAGTLVAGEEYALTVREVDARAVSFRIRIGGDCGGRLYSASPQTPFLFEFLPDVDLALAVFVRT